MILEKIARTEGSLEGLLKKAKNNDRIVLFEGQFDSWCMPYNRDVFFHSNLGFMYRNGEKIAEGIVKPWEVFKDGFVVLDKEKVLDGLKLDNVLYEGEYSWVGEMDGKLLIQKGNQILLDGVPIYQNNYEFECYEHPMGFVVVKNGCVYLNGTKPIFDIGRKTKTDWQCHERGVVVYRDNTFYLNDSFPIHFDWQTSWGTHKNGIVMCQGDKVVLQIVKL